VDADAYSTGQYRIKAPPNLPLVHIAIGGHARLHTADQDFTDLQDKWLCGLSDCSCPPGTEGQVPDNTPMGPLAAALGVTGDPGTGTRGEVSFHSLNEYCTPKKPGKGIAGTWNGHWSGGSPPASGTFTATFGQTGNSFAGPVTIFGSTCNQTGGTATGTINGTHITFGVLNSQSTITYNGELSGDHMSGTWYTAKCGGPQSGSWNADRAP
jgi:hypothetical protein